MSPIKLFLQEFYAIIENKDELLFELIERLKQNQYIYKTIVLNINDHSDDDQFYLPIYTIKQLQEVIKFERSNFYKD